MWWNISTVRGCSYTLNASNSSVTTWARAVLEIIYHYSQDLCPFKTFFCSEILQIGPDVIYWLRLLIEEDNARWVGDMLGHFQTLVRQCPVINWHFQHWGYKFWTSLLIKSFETFHSWTVIPWRTRRMTLDNFHVQIRRRVFCNLALLNSYLVILNPMWGNRNLQSIHRNPHKPSLSPGFIIAWSNCEYFCCQQGLHATVFF